MQLEHTLRKRMKGKDILLMTHIVLGYPSLATNREVIKEMVANGVDCIELQIPFSEPMADGPVILKANQESIVASTTVEDCLAFGAEMCAEHDIPFLYMTYYNIIYKYGIERFLQQAQEAGIAGLILPDLPPEEDELLFRSAGAMDIAPILIYAPTTSEERMRELGARATGFIYCTARRGVTGAHSELGDDFDEYLSRCRKATTLPLAVGFGIQSRADIATLIGKADMAVVGSRTIELIDEQGVSGVGPFIRELTGGAQ